MNRKLKIKKIQIIVEKNKSTQVLNLLDLLVKLLYKIL